MKLNRALFLVGFAVVSLILVISDFMNISSFKSNYVSSEMANFSNPGGEMANKIEISTRYGKPLDEFYGMDDLLNQFLHDYPGTSGASIILVDGKVLYSVGSQYPDVTTQLNDVNISSFKNNSNPVYPKINDFYNLLIPIRDQNDSHIASIDILIPINYFEQRLSIYQTRLITYSIIALILSAIALYIFSTKGHIWDEEGGIRRRYITIGIVIIIGIIQLIYGILNARLLNQSYKQLANETLQSISSMMESDIDRVINTGTKYSQISGLDSYAEHLLNNVPEVGAIKIGNTVIANPNGEVDGSISGNQPDGTLQLPADKGGDTLNVEFFISHKYLNKLITNTIIDLIIIFVVSISFIIELLSILILYLKKRFHVHESHHIEEDLEESNMEISIDRVDKIKLLAFISALPIGLTLCYIPIVAQSLQSTTGININIYLTALSVSIFYAVAAVCSSASGKLFGKFGLRNITIVATLLAVVGSLIAAFTNNFWIFIFARGLSGVTQGVMVPALTILAFNEKEQKARSYAVSQMNKSSYAGTVSVVVLGTMLGEKFGYKSLFAISAVIFLVLILMAYLFLIDNRNAVEVTRIEGYKKRGGFFDLVKSREVLGVVVLVDLLISLSSNFLGYYIPIFCVSSNISVQYAGRGYFLYGILLADTLRITTRLFNRRYFMGIISSIIGIVLSMEVFTVMQNVLSIFVIAIILGLSEGVGTVMKPLYFAKLKVLNKIEVDRAMGYYSSIRLGNKIISPYVFSIAIMLGTIKGIEAVIIGTLVLLLVSIVMSIPRENDVVMAAE